MISSLSGTLLQVGLTGAVLDVQGKGYAVELTASHAASLTTGGTTSIHTILIVRNDSLTVYGFATTDERDLFEQLLSVTGVGPRHALAALSTYDAAILAHAIQSGDDKPFQKVPGIGPKTARMIVMNLRGNVTGHATAEPLPAEAATTETRARTEAIDGLMSLGWKKRAVHVVVEAIFTADPKSAATMDTATLIRAALALLA